MIGLDPSIFDKITGIKDTRVKPEYDETMIKISLFYKLQAV